jgi:hypothetical protein
MIDVPWESFKKYWNPMINFKLVIYYIYDVFVHTHTHMDLVVLALVVVTIDALCIFFLKLIIASFGLCF